MTTPTEAAILRSDKADELFLGTPSRFGGLSNEDDLAANTPAEFRKSSNPWTKAANTCFFLGADTRLWKWRTTEPEDRLEQLACFKAALSGWDLSHEQKEALCGWMLSEMLTEVPT